MTVRAREVRVGDVIEPFYMVNEAVHGALDHQIKFICNDDTATLLRRDSETLDILRYVR